MSEFKNRLAAVNEAIEKCEEAHEASERALEQMRMAAPGAEFDAAMQRYQRCQASFNFLEAMAQVAIEDCHAIEV